MATEIRLRLPSLHASQLRVVRGRRRFNVVRCGRRWGKTELGVYLACRVAIDQQPVGWFTPEYKYAKDAWDRLKRSLAPLIVRASEQDKRIILLTGGAIEVWTLDTNDDAGRSRKYKLAVFDEAGITHNLRTVWRGAVRATLADLKGDAWFLGTSKPEVPYFNDLFDRGERGDEDWAAFQLETADNPFIDPDEIEQARRDMPDWLYDQEFRGIPVEGETTFFSRRVVLQHIAQHARPPAVRGVLDAPAATILSREQMIRSRDLAAVRLHSDGKGPWKLWEVVRPAPDLVMGVDLGYGAGASNTIFSLGRASTRTKLAEFQSPGVTEDEAARLAAIAGLYFGTAQHPALINFEANGPGERFCRELRALGYTRLYRRRYDGAEARAGVKADYGWWSDNQSKHRLLGQYRSDLAAGRVVNPSEPALRECLRFRIDELGRVITDTQGDDDAPEDGARAPHGDRVIADALMVEAFRAVSVPAPQPDRTPAGSYARYARQIDGQDDDDDDY